MNLLTGFNTATEVRIKKKACTILQLRIKVQNFFYFQKDMKKRKAGRKRAIIRVCVCKPIFPTPSHCHPIFLYSSEKYAGKAILKEKSCDGERDTLLKMEKR